MSFAFAQNLPSVEDIEMRLQELEKKNNEATTSFWLDVGLLAVAMGGIIGFLVEYKQNQKSQGVLNLSASIPSVYGT